MTLPTPFLAMFLVLGGLSWTAGAQARPDFSLAIASDIHYLAPGLHDDGQAFQDFLASGDGKDLLHIEAIVEAWLAELGRSRPRALIVTGDLTTNGERASHLALAAKLRALTARGIGVYVIPGNHDIDNPWARSFQGSRQLLTASVDPEEFADIYRDCGYGVALSRDAASLSYVARPQKGLRLLMLDSCLYEDNEAQGGPVTGGRLAPATLSWMRAQAALAKAAGDIMIAAVHHSVLDHSPVIREGYTLGNGPEVAELLSSLGIRLVFSGHIHIQDATARVLAGGSLYDIASNALSVCPNQYGILDWKASRGTLEYRTRRVDVAAWAKGRGLGDPYLLDFRAASERAFSLRAQRLLSRLGDGGAGGGAEATGGETALAAAALGTLNLRYFAGRESLNATDPGLAEGLALLEAESSGFLSSYVESILSDDGVDDNSLSIGP